MIYQTGKLSHGLCLAVRTIHTGRCTPMSILRKELLDIIRVYGWGYLAHGLP
jgi:hypothetical protein